jgi:cytochrome P450
VIASLPPGPKPSLQQLLSLREGPHEFIARLVDDHGHAVRYGVGPFAFSLFTHPDAVQHVLVTQQRRYDKDTFQYRLLSEITGEGLLTTDGDVWLQRRRLQQPSFHRDRVAEFGPVFTYFAEQMTERWRPLAARGDTIDVAAEMMHVALQSVVKTLFGVEIGDRADKLARAALTVLHHIMFRARTLGSVPRWLPLRLNREARTALAILDDAILGTIARRRKNGSAPASGGADLLARLMSARDPDTGTTLTDRELRNEMITMLIAGHETVASALTWTWYLLACNPGCDNNLADEVSQNVGGRTPTAADLAQLPYTAAVFQEAMRLYPPAWIITRRARELDTVMGYAVRRGSLVVLSPYVTQRHPDFWNAPERFDPQRFLVADPSRHRYAHFPFGGGPHLCIGNHFAMVEAALIIATIVRDYRLTLVDAMSVTVDPGITLQPKGGLRMRADLRR